MKVFSIFTLTVSILLGALPASHAQTSSANDDFELVKVSDGVYAAVARQGGRASGNAGFIAGDDGVAVIDTFFTPAASEELIAAIAEQTNRPIRFVINTHYHLDHTGGNQVFAARNVPIIAHDRVTEWQTTKNLRFLPPADELKKRRDDLAKQLAQIAKDQSDKRAELERQIRRVDAMMEIHLTNPTMTFGSGTIHLYLGKREVRLFTLPGHTGGDVLAFVPDANVLFTGDLAWSKTLPNMIDASVDDWIASLETILKEYPTARFIVGHGQPASAAELRELRDYLDDLRARVKKAIAGGLTLEQTKKQLTLPEKYKNFAFQNFAEPNVESVYRELTAAK